jgi:hypothetical protein
MKEVELEPVKITRYPCGRGEAENRYYYQALFVAPEDAEDVVDGHIIEVITRKKNKGFNPKDFTWNGNTALG